jgi:hypothetical protein
VHASSKAWNGDEKKRRTEFEMDGVQILRCKMISSSLAPEPKTKVELDYIFLQTSMEKLVQRLAFFKSIGLPIGELKHFCKNNI